MKVFNNILETIGNTPLVKINNIVKKKGVNIYAKFEGTNPTGSIKDRIALKMIEQAEAEGKLNGSKTIIEATSGNTGIALAMIGAVKGYPVEIVMSEAVSIERQKMIKAFGAKIILTPKNLGTDGAIKKVKELMINNPLKYYTTDQFSNESNTLAHYMGTAKEIWEQTGGNIDYIVCALGTSGTIMGSAKYLKEKNPKIKVISAHPVKGHYIQGLKNMKEAIVPALYDESMIDETIMIESEEAFETARNIAKKEGIFAGMSSGAAMLAAIKLSEKIGKGSIVVIFPDRGEKYLSTDLFKV
jgi:cysteine synthase B